MWLTFFLLLIVGLLCVTLGALGLKRGRVIAIPPFNADRREKPGKFWYGIVFQFVLGGMGLLLAVDEIAPFGFGRLLKDLVG